MFLVYRIALCTGNIHRQRFLLEPLLILLVLRNDGVLIEGKGLHAIIPWALD